MKVESNNESIEVSDGQLSRYQDIDLIGKGYKNPVRPWTQILNENFLNLASKLKGVFVTLSEKADRADVHTKEEVNTLLTQRIASLLGSAPEAYDTLSEIAAKLQSDDNAFSVINEILQNKANTNHTHTNDHTHLRRFITAGSGYQNIPVGSLVDIFASVKTSFGLSSVDDYSIVLPVGVFLVDITLSMSSFSSVGNLVYSVKYGGNDPFSLYAYPSTSTLNYVGAGHVFFPVVSDGVSALTVTCNTNVGSGKSIVRTSIVEL